MKCKTLILVVLTTILFTVSLNGIGSVQSSFAASWTEDDQGQNVVFLPMIYTPPAWVEVGAGSASGGGISNSISNSNDASIDVAPDGTPNVVWNDFSAGDSEAEIYVRRWNGITWEEVGMGSASGAGISNTAGGSYSPSIAIASDGTPYVAWYYYDYQNTDNSEIYVRRWNGSFWEEVGTGSAGGGGISNNVGSSEYPVIAIAPNDVSYVAWHDSSSGNVEIYVRRWNGTNWEEVGAGSASGVGISNTVADSYRPSIAIDPNGLPYIAWDEHGIGTINHEIYVRSWDGSDWVEVGVNSASNGGISNDSTSSWSASVAIAMDGTPYVAWSNYGAEIYVRRWDGNNWVEVGAGSASGGGISHDPDPLFSSSAPSIAISPDGTPYVTWQTSRWSFYGIYIRRWNGRYWEEVGIESATGGGFSTNAGGAYNPSLAIAPDGTPFVAWEGGGDTSMEIFVLCFIE